jgi:dCMP deaminase
LLQCSKYGIPVAGSTLYVTHFPCLQCSKAIIQAGIKKVIYATDYKNDEYALKLFEQSGVTVDHVSFDEKKVDFSSDNKLELFNEMLQKMQLLGIGNEELTPYKQRVDDLFGK